MEATGIMWCAYHNVYIYSADFVSRKEVPAHKIHSRPDAECFTDDYSRFTWVFFFATKDETSPILKTFITGIEDQLSLKVKVIRSDNGTEFKNNDLNQTLIKAARTMLADSLLPIPFWAEAVNTACYIQNKVLVTKPHNKTPYEVLHGRTPSIGFKRPFGCPVTIFNTLDSIGKFNGKVDEGFLVGYSNNDGDAAFDGKEHDFDAKKPESEVSVSPSSIAQSRKQDDKTKKEARGKIPTDGQTFPNSTNTFSATGPSNPKLEDITYSDDEDDVGAEADFNNLETSITVSPILTTRVHKDHTVSQIIGDLSSTTQTRRMKRVEEPKRVHQALKDPSWIEAMQEKLHPFKMLKVWVLVDLPHGKRALEEGINYEEVFAPVARIEALRLFLSYASFMGFMVYQMDVKSAFLYGIIEEEVYVCQPSGFEDPDHPNKVYKVVKALYGLHQAPRACQDKYVDGILRKFGLTQGKSASIPIDAVKPLLKDPDGENVDVHTYRSMIGSLMYLTSSRPDIMFAVFLSGIESLKRMSHGKNIISAGYLTTQQMVLNSPRLTHIRID
nr:hypothetical protein [Tanacetum cinerariifolium]